MNLLAGSCIWSLKHLYEFRGASMPSTKALSHCLSTSVLGSHTRNHSKRQPHQCCKDAARRQRKSLERCVTRLHKLSALTSPRARQEVVQRPMRRKTQQKTTRSPSRAPADLNSSDIRRHVLRGVSIQPLQGLSRDTPKSSAHRWRLRPPPVVRRQS